MGKNKKPKTHDKNPAGHNNRKNSCKDLPQSEDRTKELQSSNAEGHDPVQKKSSKQNEKFKQKEVAYKSREGNYKQKHFKQTRSNFGKRKAPKKK